MLKAKNSFLESISQARDLSSLYEFLKKSIVTPFSYDDLLRYQTVHVVSAFDKLIHDLIRIGMVESFSGRRQATSRYHAEPISISLHSQLISATFPPKEMLFEQEIVKKLAYLSFQDPTKLVDGLSLIWQERHKWQKICQKMKYDPATAKTKMKLIVSRRNAIVHEADIQPITGIKTAINVNDCTENTDFLENCGVSIFELVC